jgi:N-acylglucosamine-6-phosphate 2-epimerase
VQAHSSNGDPDGATASPSTTAGLLARLEGSLVVSCQAPVSSPMRDTATMARVAHSALLGGAQGLRLNGPEDVAAVRRLTDVPIIGLYKEFGARRNVITVRPEQALELAEAGADVIAVDTTREVFDDLAAAVRAAGTVSGRPVMADVSTLDEGLVAWDAGALFVGTTLAGYTPYTRGEGGGPDIELVGELASRGLRVIAEGRYGTPEQVSRAFEAGAFAVVVGGAITDPVAITRRFAVATPRGAS